MAKLTGKGKERRDEKKYYELQNMKEVGTIDGKIVLSTRVACAALRCLRCGIHKTRPRICRGFPPAPDQDFYKMARQHGCTYRFKKIYLKGKKPFKSKLI